MCFALLRIHSVVFFLFIHSVVFMRKKIFSNMKLSHRYAWSFVNALNDKVYAVLWILNRKNYFFRPKNDTYVLLA